MLNPGQLNSVQVVQSSCSLLQFAILGFLMGCASGFVPHVVPHEVIPITVYCKHGINLWISESTGALSLPSEDHRGHLGK